MNDVTQGEATTETIGYGENISFVVDNLPRKSLVALAQRGLNHVLGNEAMAKATNAMDKLFAGHFDGKHHDGESAPRPDWSKYSKDQRKASFTHFRETRTEEYGRILRDAQNAFVKAIEEGVLGQSTRGPGIDPLERQMAVIAREEIAAILRSKNVKVPTKDATITIAGKQKTMADMISTRLAHPTYGPAIKEAAQRVLDERAARAEAAKQSADSADGVDAEELGL